jgi:nicotinamide mononucleotide adenylyltransferase
MFEMASDYVRHNLPEFEVVAGYLSPVSDAYGKVGLAPCHHRVNMCRAAAQQSPWIMVDPFEAQNRDADGKFLYVPTAQVLRHFDHEINTVLGGIEGPDGQKRRARITLLAGRSIPVLPGVRFASCYAVKPC